MIAELGTLDPMVDDEHLGSDRASAAFGARYTVEEEIGRGATAVVVRARDISSGGAVAIKQLRAELAIGIEAEKFWKEVRNHKQLAHPSIVPVLDAGEQDGRPFLVLPYLAGGTLRARILREKQMQIGEAIAVTCTVARALEAAHAQNLIHRDVKPENILFDERGEVYLADFGIARAVILASGDTQSTVGIIRGTIPYMSPEQASGQPDLDGRSDVYSLACVLYEMIGGVQPFVGASPQSVMLQRVSHMPRPVNVYRPSVPLELERVVEKAFAIAPADRYRSAAEFADALERVRGLIASGQVTAIPGATPKRRRLTVVGGVAAVFVAAVLLGNRAGVMPWNTGAPPDTTRIAVFPIENAPSGAAALARGLARWRGVSMVDDRAMAEALAGTSAPGAKDLPRIARRLQAGRYIAGRVDGAMLSATLYDVGGGALHTSGITVPMDAGGVPGAYALLADSLLLRGQADDAPDHSEAGSRNLVATQLMIAGRAALFEWDLDQADSIFSRAAAADSITHRPLAWMAQVREWRGDNADAWLPAATAALADSGSLSRHELALARGLVLLGGRDFTNACGVYRVMVEDDPQSFLGWFGLGECQRNDVAVVPDPRSPTGWRFRASYHAALSAYVRAFDLLPTTYRGFQQDGFVRLRRLLTLDFRKLPRGVSLDAARAQFLGWPSLSGDTIVIVPMPQADVFAGKLPVEGRKIAAAGARLRELFRTIASRWAAAQPRSAGTKEAFAVSLELAGDASTIDSLARAQALASAPLQRLRLAAMRAFALLKFGVPSSPARVEEARRLADSLLNAVSQPNAEEARLLAPMAALGGRCRKTAALLGTALPGEAPASDITVRTAGEANVLLGYAALGCAADSSVSLARLIGDVRAPSVTSPEGMRFANNVILRIVGVSARPDPNIVSQVSTTGASYVVRACDELLRGHADSARIRLGNVANQRRDWFPGDLVAEAALPDARLWLRLGDSASAVGTLAQSLDYVRKQAPI
ncbi:MAG TPA: serine/threonine-protein kinase, partial [Gemmatimonadaceae bacterium]|nr:serine/threonine-protein kinase [Gemmatimonadaceae bacterium]